MYVFISFEIIKKNSVTELVSEKTSFREALLLKKGYQIGFGTSPFMDILSKILKLIQFRAMFRGVVFRVSVNISKGIKFLFLFLKSKQIMFKF